MKIENINIDHGKAFDWGQISQDYAKYRDIYPNLFYQKITQQGLCVEGQNVLDLGTGTGVLPRNLYAYGAKWTGTDISPEQIEMAKALSAKENKNIDYCISSAEQLDFPPQTLDVITACQCYFYFDAAVVYPKLRQLLKPNGKVALLYMAWLPEEDVIAKASEQLILRYNPDWSGANETRHPIHMDAAMLQSFHMISEEIYDLKVPFTRESWNGRLKACRGIGASLPASEMHQWEAEHLQLLTQIAPPAFSIQHFAAMTILQRNA